ncbi:MAG: T9SS type A sorting domain-containing protein [Saprospiraceae bacterium]|nr:T9SS type A sorting domain-containing protein [Saprospiraceae bacterium]
MTSTTGDCNDNNAAINPAATEICDGIDNDCDGNTDEGVLTTFYADADNDGYGNPSNTTLACSVPEGYVSNNTDCDDTDPLERPGQVWYKDTDNDGYGQTGAATLTQCLRPAGYKVSAELTSTTGDCNDNNAAINPAATEICDGIDNDCDGNTDEGVLTTFYADSDNDGFGNPSSTTMACSVPEGYVSNNTDCDDTDPLERPGQVWYKDTDNDNYGQTGAATLTQCLRPAGYKVSVELTSTTGDCNDNNAAINPAATEICDGIDNDCDGNTDEGVLTTFYADTDNDGFGNPSNSTLACSVPEGFVSNNTDCDDSDPLEFPGQVWYKDTDNDDYGQTGSATITQCLRPAGYKVFAELTSTTGDCNDNNAAINPAATEICDGIDNDCDGNTDEGVLTTYYADTDNDGFGNPSNTTLACSVPEGYVSNNTDCDDTDPLEHPGQIWYKDTDNDGYGQTGAATITQCLRPAGYKVPSELTSTSGDCNDDNSDINPDALEICDEVDNDCNGLADDVFGTNQANWNHGDIGNANGNSDYPPCFPETNDIFFLESEGVGGNNNDVRHFVYQTLCGDMSISARVVNINGGGWAGVSIHETMASGSKKVALKTQLTNLIFREIRAVTGGNQNLLTLNRPQHIWLKLERVGNSFTGYTSINGSTWSMAFTTNIAMNSCINIGLFSQSINNSTTTHVEFDNVHLNGSNNQSRPENTFMIEANIDLNKDWDVDVYPNPSSGEIILNMLSSSEEKINVEIIHSTGIIVHSSSLDALDKSIIDLSGQAAGLYHARFTSEKGKILNKRIILIDNQ